jgi:hypothetical protein
MGSGKDFYHCEHGVRNDRDCDACENEKAFFVGDWHVAADDLPPYNHDEVEVAFWDGSDMCRIFATLFPDGEWWAGQDRLDEDFEIVYWRYPTPMPDYPYEQDEDDDASDKIFALRHVLDTVLKAQGRGVILPIQMQELIDEILEETE